MSRKRIYPRDAEGIANKRSTVGGDRVIWEAAAVDTVYDLLIQQKKRIVAVIVRNIQLSADSGAYLIRQRVAVQFVKTQKNGSAKAFVCGRIERNFDLEMGKRAIV